MFDLEVSEEVRAAIVDRGPVYLSDGLRANLAGIKMPHCTVSSARPGFWRCTWQTARDVAARPDRRFTAADALWGGSTCWLGYAPRAEDYQTPEDYLRAKERGEAI